jgi:site-specific recombinase XerD
LQPKDPFPEGAVLGERAYPRGGGLSALALRDRTGRPRPPARPTRQHICRLLRALRPLQREQKPGRYVFMSEGGAPTSAVAFRRMVTRLGPAAKMPFGIHPHMLRHSTGFKLANQGVDTRSLQHYLGHKNIQHTVRYSELSPERFRDFWKD